MSEERAPTDAEMAALFVMLKTTRTLVAHELRGCLWHVWLARGLVLLNVGTAAWNASGIETSETPWALVAGMLFCTWGAWISLKSERDWQGLIRQGRSHLQELDKNMEQIERDRNESRA